MSSNFREDLPEAPDNTGEASASQRNKSQRRADSTGSTPTAASALNEDGGSPRRSQRRHREDAVAESEDSGRETVRSKSTPSRRKKRRKRTSRSKANRSKSSVVRSTNADYESHPSYSPYTGLDEDPQEEEKGVRSRGRYTNHSEGLVDTRTRRMSTWRAIWTINGFLTPWLSSWIRRFFHSRMLRWLGRQSPWMLVLLQLTCLGVVGQTGLPIVPEELGVRWYASKGGVLLGGWGYRDGSAVGGVVKPFYDISLPQDGSENQDERVLQWTGTPIFSGLILGAGAYAVILLLLVLWIVLLLWTNPRGASCLTCGPWMHARLERGIDKSEGAEEESGGLREPKQRWQVALEWVMWTTMVVVVTLWMGLELWCRFAAADGLFGDDAMTAAAGLAAGWVIVWRMYRSYWALGLDKDDDYLERD